LKRSYKETRQVIMDIYHKILEEHLENTWLDGHQYALTPTPYDIVRCSFDRMRWDVWSITWMDYAIVKGIFSRSCNRNPKPWEGL